MIEQFNNNNKLNKASAVQSKNWKKHTNVNQSIEQIGRTDRADRLFFRLRSSQKQGSDEDSVKSERRRKREGGEDFLQKSTWGVNKVKDDCVCVCVYGPRTTER